MEMTPEQIEARRKGGQTTVRRYGAGFVGRRARAAMVTKRLAEVAHPERLSEASLEAFERQVWTQHAAMMRDARATKRAARLTHKEPEATQTAPPT